MGYGRPIKMHKTYAPDRLYLERLSGAIELDDRRTIAWRSEAMRLIQMLMEHLRPYNPDALAKDPGNGSPGTRTE